MLRPLYLLAPEHHPEVRHCHRFGIGRAPPGGDAVRNPFNNNASLIPHSVTISGRRDRSASIY